MNFGTSKAVREFCKTASNMYRLGWDERNGGNLSVLLDAEDVAPFPDTKRVIRRIPLGFDALPLSGRYILLTGTGKYFKNIEENPETDLGLLRISSDGREGELVWGFSDGGLPTSETPAHLMSHIARLRVDPEHRVILHSHPTYTLAMNRVLPLDEKIFTRTLWKMCTECIVVFPDGVGVLPWMVCGTNEIGEATAEKMKKYRLVIWGLHGIYGAGRTLDEAFGLVETVEKAARLYLLTAHLPQVNTIKREELRAVAEFFGVDYRKDFLDDSDK